MTPPNPPHSPPRIRRIELRLVRRAVPVRAVLSTFRKINYSWPPSFHSAVLCGLLPHHSLTSTVAALAVAGRSRLGPGLRHDALPQVHRIRARTERPPRPAPPCRARDSLLPLLRAAPSHDDAGFAVTSPPQERRAHRAARAALRRAPSPQPGASLLLPSSPYPPPLTPRFLRPRRPQIAELERVVRSSATAVGYWLELRPEIAQQLAQQADRLKSLRPTLDFATTRSGAVHVRAATHAVTMGAEYEGFKARRGVGRGG